MTWTELFERAGDHDVTEDEVRDALARRREPDAAGESGTAGEPGADDG
ncbi:MAG: hypothetical protein ABEH66_04045 [Halobacteriales archaeon]